MATLNWPNGILPASFDWYLTSNGSSFTSPWTGQTQTVRYPGSAWKAQLTLSNLDDYESREVEVILVQLDGMAGRIKLRDFGRFAQPVKGTPRINGAGQKGVSVNTDGWTPSTKVLSKGDYITIADELKLVTADVTSNASGAATVPFGPQLRNSPSDDLVIEVSNPYGIFRLEKNENGVKRSPAFNNDITLNFVEVF
jgi:hypothetical protein